MLPKLDWNRSLPERNRKYTEYGLACQQLIFGADKFVIGKPSELPSDPEKPAGIVHYCGGHRLPVYPLNFRHFVENEADIGRLVRLPPVRNRRKVRAVRLGEEPVRRRHRDDERRPFAVLERNRAVKAEIKAHLQELFGCLLRTGEAMAYAGDTPQHSFPLELFKNRQRV